MSRTGFCGRSTSDLGTRDRRGDHSHRAPRRRLSLTRSGAAPRHDESPAVTSRRGYHRGGGQGACVEHLAWRDHVLMRDVVAVHASLQFLEQLDYAHTPAAGNDRLTQAVVTAQTQVREAHRRHLRALMGDPSAETDADELRSYLKTWSSAGSTPTEHPDEGLPDARRAGQPLARLVGSEHVRASSAFRSAATTSGAVVG